MPTDNSPHPLTWKELYHAAMIETDVIKLQPLLDDAMNALLDRIEDTFTEPDGELKELNNALNRLRVRRKEISSWNREQAGNSDKTKAA